VKVVELLDESSEAVKVAGACNAVKRLHDGRLLGDQFDGAGFVRGALRKGVALHGARVLVVGCGGVGCPIAASLAGAGVAEIALHDVNAAAAQALAARLRTHHPNIRVSVGGNDPAGFDVVVNATPLGMSEDDPMPFDVSRLDARTFVGEVVMRTELTPLLKAAQARGCRTQVGTDMLFEMIPAYLEFFGFPSATPDRLRSLSTLSPRT
jgi:shikimate dehydrogenase